jgi:hypothetical protein
MSDPVADTNPDDSRSGETIAEAIDVAEAGSRVEHPHDHGQDDVSGTAPVENTYGDPEMTQGQVVYGDDDTRTGGSDVAPGTTPGATPQSSGVAQSVPGARPIDKG